MEFKQLSINGIIYEERDGNIYQLRSNKQIEIFKVGLNNSKQIPFREFINFFILIIERYVL